MQELDFEEFISFGALFFIHEHLKFPASAFHDFNKEYTANFSKLVKIFFSCFKKSYLGLRFNFLIKDFFS